MFATGFDIPHGLCDDNALSARCGAAARLGVLHTSATIGGGNWWRGGWWRSIPPAVPRVLLFGRDS